MLFNLKSFLAKPLRFLVVAFACTLLLFSGAMPAFAFGHKSAPSADSPRYDVSDKAEDALKAGLGGQKELDSQSEEGYNGVQGKLGMEDKVNRPDSAQEGKTLKDKVEQVLETVTGQNQ